MVHCVRVISVNSSLVVGEGVGIGVIGAWVVGAGVAGANVDGIGVDGAAVVGATVVGAAVVVGAGVLGGCTKTTPATFDSVPAKEDKVEHK